MTKHPRMTLRSCLRATERSPRTLSKRKVSRRRPCFVRLAENQRNPPCEPLYVERSGVPGDRRCFRRRTKPRLVSYGQVLPEHHHDHHRPPPTRRTELELSDHYARITACRSSEQRVGKPARRFQRIGTAERRSRRSPTSFSARRSGTGGTVRRPVATAARVPLSPMRDYPRVAISTPTHSTSRRRPSSNDVVGDHWSSANASVTSAAAARTSPSR